MDNLLKNLRKKNNLTLEQLSSLTSIDKSILSKFESGKRIPSDRHITILSKILEVPYSEINTFFKVEKVVQLLRYEPHAESILTVAEERIKYLSKENLKEFDLTVDQTILDKLDYVDQLKEEWKDSKPLNKTQLEKMHEYFNIKYTYDSNQIEGNTLTYQETSLVVNEGITISGKSMREHLEVVNHSDAVDFINDLVLGKEEISRRSVLEIHRLVLKSIDQENAGKYRNVPVRISGSSHVPPEPYLIFKLMEDYFEYYETQRKRIHPVLLAAEMHERLVSIHPFIDGNGMTSRLIMNFILMNNGFTVTSLKGDIESRLKYYKALEKVQVNNESEDFYHLILDRLIDSLKEHLQLSK